MHRAVGQLQPDRVVDVGKNPVDGQRSDEGGGRAVHLDGQEVEHLLEGHATHHLEAGPLQDRNVNGAVA